jgi:hypothetical protein
MERERRKRRKMIKKIEKGSKREIEKNSTGREGETLKNYGRDRKIEKEKNRNRQQKIDR